MKISESWLNEWVDSALPIDKMAALLTMAGLEVDSINPVAGAFTRVIVALVRKTKPHPEADRLTLCEVDVGNNQLLQVVCGAKNVRAGLKVALAQIGAKLPPNIEIKETRLRGELSQGMLCSSSELGLTDTSEGILELAEEAPLGVDLREYLNLDDQVLDIDLTPNRADCLSVQGIAREVAAITKQELRSFNPPQCQPAIRDELTLRVEASDACPRYCGRIIQGVDSTAMTPLWMSERLRRSGIRAIHPVVDVTNYVMLELGQPMHAFNLQKIQGALSVRFAHTDEKIALLDGTTADFSRDSRSGTPLVIADENEVLAIAGVMGGEASAVDAQTRDIFLESAFFTPTVVAGVARSYGLTTESSQRFERGVDSCLQEIALERATELLLAITGGKAGPISRSVNHESLPKSTEIQFNPERVKQLIGISLSLPEMKGMLQALGMQVNDAQAKWVVTVPSYRFDIALDVDLIEEIVRLHGYDKIFSEKMLATVQPGVINPLEVLTQQLIHFFTSRAYHETITYSFVDPKIQKLLYPDAVTLDLINPISSELSSMRLSLWPGLLASMRHNSHRQQSTIKLFESGVTFASFEGSLEEKHCFAGLILGEVVASNWLLEKRRFDFYDLKGDLQALFSSLHLPDLEFRAIGSHTALHPGKSAQLWLNGQAVGWCGVLHPCLAETLDLVDEVIIFELQLEQLIARPATRYEAISKFPFIRRDLALLVDNTLTFADVESLVKQTVDEVPAHKAWLKSFDIFDVYVGAGIPANKKSFAVSLVLQDDYRTLVDSEINEVINAIITRLGEKLAITLRD